MTSNTKIDPLMQCLIVLTQLNYKPATSEALSHGLPLDPTEIRQRLFSMEGGKANFSRAAARAGFSATLVKRKLKHIPTVVLPAILLLQNDSACVITAMDVEAGTAEIIVPQIDETPQEITLEKLNEEYLGYTFFLKKLYIDRRPEYDDDKEEHNKNWFFGTLWRFKGIYGNVVLASLVINIFVVVGPLFTMNVYDRIIPHNAVDTLWVLALGMFIIYSFDLFLKFVRTYFLEVIAKKSDVILSSKIFEQALNIKLKEKPKSVGSFANNIRDFDSIRSFYSSSALVAFIDFPFVIIFLLVIFYVAGVLVVVPIAIILAIISYSLIVRKPLQRSIESTYESSARRNGLLIEALSNIENIKSFNASSSVQWGWEERTGDIAGKSLRSRMLSTSLSSVSVFFTQLSTVGIIVTGVYLIKQGDLTMGGLIATVILSSRTIAPMSQVASLLSNYQQMKTSLAGLNDLMNKEVERPEQKNFLRRPVFKGAVEFKNVSFSYPEETNVVLSGINLKINPNERIGIIGQVGSGKSTFSKLILGLYEPKEGSVFVDGIDIQQMDPADLRHNVSYVPQDVTLFSGTVRENIVFKAPHSDDEAILEAVKVGNVNSFTDKHPMGLDMFVGERGANLSGGQRQAVGVARAMLTESSIVLLDEPTNSMDFTTEAKVIQSLKKATEGKTTIVITHKPSILAIVDRLIVMEGGKIVMDGPKNEVLQKLGKSK
ncbi:MAG: type I secretion system permease/ATPase [Denitrovibrio sp.]|nr:MAG: type I secretion system permease/ATPase [Denitrovibrio sp.]